MRRVLNSKVRHGAFSTLHPGTLAAGFAAVMLASSMAPAMAQVVTAPVNLTMVRTGWNADSFAVVTSQAVVNPAHCPIPDGYVSTKPAPGYASYYDAAKLAWQTSRRVQVSIDATLCVAGRPKIIGINVLP